MSIFTYNSGRLDGFAKILTDTSATVLLTAGEPGKELIVLNYRAALPTGASSTTVQFDLYDGSTAYVLNSFVTINADERYPDRDPVFIPSGWSLRATRTSGGNAAITGVYVLSSNT